MGRFMGGIIENCLGDKETDGFSVKSTVKNDD